MKLLITGATGFIGQNLCVAALEQNYSISATMRPTSNPDLLPAAVEKISIGSVATTLPENALANVDVVIHLAARVHVMKDFDRDPLTAYRQINTIATLSLARQAVEKGVKRFIYVSSIKVNGEGSATFPVPRSLDADAKTNSTTSGVLSSSLARCASNT